MHSGLGQLILHIDFNYYMLSFFKKKTYEFYKVAWKEHANFILENNPKGHEQIHEQDIVD